MNKLGQDLSIVNQTLTSLFAIIEQHELYLAFLKEVEDLFVIINNRSGCGDNNSDSNKRTRY